MKYKLLLVIPLLVLILSGCTPAEFILNNHNYMLNDTEFAGNYRSMDIDKQGNFYEYDGNILVYIQWDDESNSGLDMFYVFDTYTDTAFRYEIIVFRYDEIINDDNELVIVRNAIFHNLDSNEYLYGIYSVWDGYVILQMNFPNGTMQYILVDVDPKLPVQST